MSRPDDETAKNVAEIERLSRAAEEVATRRRFLRNAALAAAWTAPLVETLVVAPDAEAQGHGHGHGHGHDMGEGSKPPMGHGHG